MSSTETPDSSISIRLFDQQHMVAASRSPFIGEMEPFHPRIRQLHISADTRDGSRLVCLGQVSERVASSHNEKSPAVPLANRSSLPVCVHQALYEHAITVDEALPVGTHDRFELTDMRALSTPTSTWT